MRTQIIMLKGASTSASASIRRAVEKLPRSFSEAILDDFEFRVAPYSGTLNQSMLCVINGIMEHRKKWSIRAKSSHGNTAVSKRYVIRVSLLERISPVEDRLFQGDLIRALLTCAASNPCLEGTLREAMRSSGMPGADDSRQELAGDLANLVALPSSAGGTVRHKAMLRQLSSHMAGLASLAKERSAYE